jgi:hypothetical protein
MAQLRESGSSVGHMTVSAHVSGEDLLELELGATGARRCAHSAIIPESSLALWDVQGRGSRISGGYMRSNSYGFRPRTDHNLDHGNWNHVAQCITFHC